MKNFATRTLLALALCAATAAAALADGTTTKQVSFPQDVSIDGKLFKKGTYKMEYNAETGELTVFNGKGTAKTKAHVAKLDREARETVIGSLRDGDARNLQSITFRGESQSFVIGEASQRANVGQQ